MSTRAIDWSGRTPSGSAQRFQRLLDELRYALQQTDRGLLGAWGAKTLAYTGQAGLRRVARVAKLGKRLIDLGIDEAKGAANAAQQHQLAKHALNRGQAAWRATKKLSHRTKATAAALTDLLRNRETLPVAMTTIVAALVASGGPDADGGIPDLDLQFGIDAHRSIFTHSIIAGTAVEGCLYGVATIVGHIHDRLPPAHDLWWDTIDRNRVTYLQAVSEGVSAGLAYHLLIDGTLEPGSYHGLGVALPQSVHDAITTVNAVAEGMDVTQKDRTYKRA